MSKLVQPVLYEEDLEKIDQLRQLAEREVRDIATGRKSWTMRIPVQDSDSDMLLNGICVDNLRMKIEILRLRHELRQIFHYAMTETHDQALRRMASMALDPGLWTEDEEAD